jgi:small subunit ribosomal protein S8
MDILSNMLIALKNASNAKKITVEIPYSRLKSEVAKVLLSSGYIKGYSKKARKKGDVLSMDLSYNHEGKARISEVKRISKPSRRVYVAVKHIRPIKQGYGVLVLSTPKGILTGNDAVKEQVGGEVLFEMW